MQCNIGDREVTLFKIRQVSRVLGVTNEAIRKKEERGMIPPAVFHSSQGARLFSAEEIAMFDYLFKTVWRKRQGVKVPEEFKAAANKAFNIVRREVINNGKVSSSEVLEPVQEYWEDFIPGVAYSHILHWREVLLGEDYEEFDIDDFLDTLR